MKLINSVSETRYKTIDTLFISDHKWEFLADKYRITLNAEEWEELEADHHQGQIEADILYADVNGYSCLEVLRIAHNYKEVEKLLKNREFTLYTNEDKDYHILVQGVYN